MSKLKPQTLKGFNDWFASDVKLRTFVIDTFKSVFEKYGYEPLETPALEYTEFMAGISGSEAEKQFYRFRDPGDRDVMLKYEVMTAMCRAVATNIDKVPFPYKRYQIQPVWRAENTQKGRYRQFTQCDADTVGSPAMLADAEFIQMGLEIVQQLGFKSFLARISNRKLLDGLREYLNIPQDKFYGMCMAIDKLKKIGRDKVIVELINRDISPPKAEDILNILDNDNYQGMDNYQIIEQLKSTIGNTQVGNQALEELKQIFDYLNSSNVSKDLYIFDTSIARGLASYTGPVWEFDVVDGGVGSIAGCGRYDNLIGRYLGNDRQIPATGGSFGIERICDIMKDRGMVPTSATSTKIMVTLFSPEFTQASLQLANDLRSNGIETMLYPDTDKLGKQFRYASTKSIPYVAVLGEDEIKQNKIMLKDMTNTTQKLVTKDELITLLSS